MVNITLLGILILLGLTGLVTQYGSWLPWLNDLHRIAGAALILVLPWKGITIYRSLKHRGKEEFRSGIVQILSLILTLLILLSVTIAIMWMWRLGPYSSLNQTLMAWHWILGLAIMPLLAIHVWWGQPRLQIDDFLTRRSILQLLGLAGISIILSKIISIVADAQATAESPRRFTGSRAIGLYTGNAFPFTGEATVSLNSTQWRLVLDGAVQSPLNFTYKELLSLQQKVITEAIDCHNGWYSVQEWQGVPLTTLLDRARMNVGVSGVRLISVTGLSDTFPIAEARKILLATHVSGEVLEPRHGFPLRAVVPGWRGWFWLKWLTDIEVLQDPLDVVTDILCTPLQVFRELK